MNLMWIASGALAGLPAGTALRGPVARLSVPAGEPDELTCPDCAAELPSRPALRCGHCGSPIGAAFAIELVTAAVIALLAARFGARPVLTAFAFASALGVALAQIDAAVQRLPDRLTLPAYPALILLLTLAAAIGNAWSGLVRAMLGGLVLAAAYLVLGLASRGQLGGGDIKLAGLIGILLGWLGWPALIAGACLGFLLAAAVGVALLAARRVSRHALISFGPYMLAGALLAALAHGP